MGKIQFSDDEQHSIDFITERYENAINELIELRKTINEMKHSIGQEAYEEIEIIGQTIDRMMDGMFSF